jgi:hypothetical protein
MSFPFYFENGLRNIVNEDGNDSIDVTENENPFKLQELNSYRNYVALRTKLVDSE